MHEEWKDIEGWPGYMVSSKGRVISPDRVLATKDKNGVVRTRTHRGRVLSLTVNAMGYPVADLRCCGRRKNASIHRLVAIAFVENPDGKPHVNHIDGDKTNASAENLEWCTHKENMRHGYDSGLIQPRKLWSGDNSIASKLRSDQVSIIKKRIAAGESVKSIARDYSDIVGESAIGWIKRGRTWKEVEPSQ